MGSALMRQKAGDLAGAEALYRQALTIQSDEPDCLHMLGVICLETGRNNEAFEAVYRALSLTEWRIDAMRHNMGLILAGFLADADADAARDMQQQYLEYCRQRDARRVNCDPLVSIVLPSYNHGRWIQKALESVYSQTYRRLELIVIDDGSTDDSPDLIRQSLTTCPFPSHFVARENRGAHVTINEGVALATGEYINILNSDDWFPDARIAAMVEGVARRDADWGFGGVSFVNAADKPISPTENRRVFNFMTQMERMSQWDTLGVALLSFNFMISTGNLFVRKTFLDALGGFGNYRYNHDWDFCLRATLESEPIFIPRNTYAYRMHESNTISESPSGQGPLIEAGLIFSDYFAVATQGPAPKNKFAPTAHVWGARFFYWTMRDGKAELLPVDVLRGTADIVRSGAQWDFSGPTPWIFQSGKNEGLVETGETELPDGFDPDVYLGLNPDLVATGVDPTTHYLEHGRREGRVYSLPRKESTPTATDRPEVPEGFDPDVYLKLNPDVAAAGLDATTHYLEHGRREGRPYMAPSMVSCGDDGLNSNREIILVVSHEASRTGAPILGLNLVQALIERYNVVALLLGGGPLAAAFQLTGAVVVTSPNLRSNQAMANLAVDQLCERYNFKFALVNSIESRVVLSSLANHFVPAISLIHEFAAYTRPRDAFTHAILWSGKIVFSTRITMENARIEYPYLGDWSADVLPQGRCLVPSDEFSEEEIQVERARIRHLIRPRDVAKDSVVVLGAGFVQLRKGVDLFLKCAALVVNEPSGGQCRFVWIGKGYDPENDLGYSVYLKDQICRAGLQEHVFFVEETAAIEAAYEQADLLLLSSRLDPLPNVAIDAMAHRVPVLCFDKTTGIADFLTDIGLRDNCVAEYLDSADMAKKILVLAGSADLRKQVGERCREASMACFKMDNYVEHLEVMARSVCDRTRQEKADVQVILDSGLFRPDFSCPSYEQGQSPEEAVRAYVRAWASGISRRKPFPGFHPGIYLERHGVAVPGADPFADYLRAGRPDGEWIFPVIVPGNVGEECPPDGGRIALHIHAYYPELLAEIISRLSNNRVRPDLFVSIANEDGRVLVVDELEKYRGNIIAVQLVPNRGRDIGPFVTAFGQRIMADYDFIGHVHTKKSAVVKDAAMGNAWYRFLLENLLGGESGSMADRIFSEMKADASIGMVFPDDPYITGWSANRTFAESLAVRMGLRELPENFNFPVGTMFWARTSALAPLMNLKLGWEDYPEEPLPYDGTSLHAMERLFSFVGSANHLRCAVTNAKGLTR